MSDRTFLGLIILLESVGCLYIGRIVANTMLSLTNYLENKIPQLIKELRERRARADRRGDQNQ